MSPGALAAAIAAPVTALLAAVALLACCYIKRRSRLQHQHSGLGPLAFDKQTHQGSSSNMLLKDLEDGILLADTDLPIDKPSAAPSSITARTPLGNPAFGTISAAPAGTKPPRVPNELAGASFDAVAAQHAVAQQAPANAPCAQQLGADATQQHADVQTSLDEGSAGRLNLQQHHSQAALARTHAVAADVAADPHHGMDAAAASIHVTSRGRVRHSSSFRRDSSIPPCGSVRKTDAGAGSGGFCSGGVGTDIGSAACGLRQRSPPIIDAAAPSHSRRGSATLAARSSAGAPFSSGGAHSSGAGGGGRVSSAASSEPWGGSGATAGSGGQLPGTLTQGTIVPCDLSILSTAARSKRYGLGSKRSNRINDRLDSLQALLKARSDVAVLRDLKIGPLLGRGSYGRVYKGKPCCPLFDSNCIACQLVTLHACQDPGPEACYAAMSHVAADS